MPRMKRSLLATSIAAAMMATLALPAHAVDWTGAASNDWFDAGNWANPSTVPTTADDVRVDSDANPAVIAGPDAFARFIVVGDSATGSLTMINGGTLTSDFSSIGDKAGSTGTVTLIGAGSSWQNVGALDIGGAGAGQVELQGGASLFSGEDITLGVLEGSVGAMTIDGSVVSTDRSVIVGSGGQGTLVIRNGGQLDVNFDVFVGSLGSGVGEVTVQGAGSEMSSDFLVIGLGTVSGARVNIVEGAAVESRISFIGAFEGGLSELIVDGAGSTWSNTGVITVGRFGDGSLKVQNGGTVVNSGAPILGGTWRIGDEEGSSGTVTVQGPGSSLSDQQGEMRIGSRGNGTLTVGDGGTVSAVAVLLGDSATGVGSLDVNGTGSRFDSATLAVGNAGTGHLTVGGGGVVEVGGTATLGVASGSIGTATVTGTGSAWNMTQNLSVGAEGSGSLSVLDGGTVATDTDLFIGQETGSTGSVLVDDAVLNARSFFVGERGTGTLTLRNGATASSDLGLVGGDNNGVGTAVVEGSGTVWDSDLLFVGLSSGSVGELRIQNGGQVNSGFSVLGQDSGTSGAAVVSGAGSVWNTGDLNVGLFGVGTLEIRNGGAVESNGRAAIGENDLPEDATSTVLVTGAGSNWQSTQLEVGARDTGILTISEGGRVASDSLVVARDAGAIGTLNIGAASGEAPVAAGRVDTANVAFGLGAGSINFNHSDADYAFDAAIAGAGTVNVLSGTTSLTASSTYTGATVVSGGKLLVQGALSGSAVSVGGAGTLGGSGFIQGDVAVGDGGTLAPGNGIGSLKIDGNLGLSSGAHLAYELGQAGVDDASDQIQLSGDLVLDGALDIADVGGFGPGVYRLMNYGGALTDNGLEIGASPEGVEARDLFVQTAFDGQVNLVSSAGATLEFWDGGDAATHDNGSIEGGAGTWNATARNWTQADGAINGPARTGFAIFGGAAGTVTVEGEQAFTGAQFASDGYQLTAGANGALRSDAAETILRVDPGFTATVAVPLRGNTRLVKTDAGTLVLNGASAYTGGVRVAGGRLVGDSGNLLGDIANEAVLEFAQTVDGSQNGAVSGSGRLVKSGAGKLTLTGTQSYTGDTAIEAGTLAFGNAQDRSYAGVLSGAGTLEKAGAGQLTLTGDSSGFDGQTVASDGVLRIDGILGGAATIGAGAKLSGNGRLDDLTVSGAVAPGASIGTLSVTGNYTQTAGSTYEAEVDASGGSDRIVVAGSAQLAGAVTVQGAAELNRTYTLLTAGGGISGQYQAVNNATITPFLDFSLRYASDAVFLDVARSTLTFGSIGLSRNQIATGAALDRLPANSPLLGQMVNLDLNTAFYALDRLSGEIHASARGALVEDARFVRDAAGQRLRTMQGDTGRGGWAQAYGNAGSVDHDGNAAETDIGSGGVLVGADAAVGEARIGVLGGAGRISVQTDERGSKAGSDSLYVGAYAGTHWGAWGLRAGAAYARHGVETERNAVFGGVREQLRADYDVDTAQVFAELSYRIDREASSFEPYLNVSAIKSRNDAYRETGGIAALSGGAEDTDTGLAVAGARAMRRFDWAGKAASVHASLGWRHAFGDTLPLSHHAFAGGDAFVIAGTRIAEDAVVAGARLDVRLSDRATLGLGYAGQAGEDTREHSVQAHVQVKF